MTPSSGTHLLVLGGKAIRGRYGPERFRLALVRSVNDVKPARSAKDEIV
jgi:hypothetical protein